MSNYGNRFKRFLVEKDDVPEQEITDQDAMVQTLDKGTNPEDFDVDAPVAGSQVAPTMSAIQKKMYDELKGVVTELDTFSNFLNGTGPESLQSRLNSAEPETLFDKISTAETKKIARVAVEISSLSEMLKGYLATANDPKYKFN
jgi:hypothetical protein